MAKLALLKKVSFDISEKHVKLYLSDKVSFHEFGGTLDLFHKINVILGNNMLEVQNCDYDEKYLIQAFYIENSEGDLYENIVLVKREILPNDSYTYIGVTADTLLENGDNFCFVDVTFSDIETILKRKMLNKGIIVKSSGEIENITYLIKYDKETESGTIVVSSQEQTKTFTYLNVPAVANKYENKELSESEFRTILEEKIQSGNCDCFYSQVDFKMGLLNCYSPSTGLEKNEVMSKLVGDTLYGDIVVGLENYLNDDSRILDLDSNTFKKIVDLSSDKHKYHKNLNTLFCNIFYELAHI